VPEPGRQTSIQQALETMDFEAVAFHSGVALRWQRDQFGASRFLIVEYFCAFVTHWQWGDEAGASTFTGDNPKISSPP